jgi:predicted ester cyclase
MVSSLLASFPDLHNTVQETITEGNLVVVRWTSTGTFAAEFNGVPPTGKHVTWTGINIFRIECSMIAESWSEVDRLAQLGQDIGSTSTPIVIPATPTSQGA